jgi:hypothetical protein
VSGRAALDRLRTGASLTVVAALLAVGCGTTAPTPVDLPNSANVEDDIFRLEVRGSKANFKTNEPIELAITLAYVGVGEIVSYGSSNGPILFSIAQLDGRPSLLDTGKSDCVEQRIPHEPPFATGWKKPEVYTADKDNTPFWDAYVADPQLRLPPGRWRLTATVELSLDPTCRTGAATTGTMPVRKGAGPARRAGPTEALNPPADGFGTDRRGGPGWGS